MPGEQAAIASMRVALEVSDVGVDARAMTTGAGCRQTTYERVARLGDFLPPSPPAEKATEHRYGADYLGLANMFNRQFGG